MFVLGIIIGCAISVVGFALLLVHGSKDITEKDFEN